MANKNNILESISGSIKIITYNKPAKKNAMDLDMYKHMAEILETTGADDRITVAVVTGVGDYFSSGNDIQAVLARDKNENIVEILKRFVEAFINFPKALIAVVNGPAIGIAATTLALFDLVFASETAYFYTPFTQLALVPEGCSTYTFPRMLGTRMAADMLLFNRKMTAKQALQHGFVNYLYKPGELQSKVWNKIVEVSRLPKTSLASAKQLVRSHIKDDLIEVNKKEIAELEKIWHSEEYLIKMTELLYARGNKMNRIQMARPGHNHNHNHNHNYYHHRHIHPISKL